MVLEILTALDALPEEDMVLEELLSVVTVRSFVKVLVEEDSNWKWRIMSVKKGDAEYKIPPTSTEGRALLQVKVDVSYTV